MRRPRLSVQDIEALTCPPDKRDIMRAIGPPDGFFVRITRDGTKAFLLQYRAAGAVKRLSLGKMGEVSLAAARKAAEQARGQVVTGGDPAGVRKAASEAAAAARTARKADRQADAVTMARVAAQWAAVGLKDRTATHRQGALATLERHLGTAWARPVHTLTAAILQRRVDELHAVSPMMATHLRSYGRACLNWAIRRGIIDTGNPFAAIVIEQRPVSRDRVMSDAELGAAWLAAGAMPYPFGPLLQLLALTLQRLGEVAAMRWPELADDLSIWTLPAARAKNRKGHIVHLAPAARAILASLPRRAGTDLVFTTTGRTPVSGFSGATEALRAGAVELMDHGAAVAMAAEPWRLHDFRRTGVTALAGRGVAPHVADRILNHVEGTISGVAAVYQRHQFMAERKAASDLWAEHVLLAAEAARQLAQQLGRLDR